MPFTDTHWNTPLEDDLGLVRIGSSAGIGVSVMPNGCVFAIEHHADRDVTLVNQVLGSSVDGGIGRILLRTGAVPASTIEVVGPHANVRLGSTNDSFVWQGDTREVRHYASLQLLEDVPGWLWRVEATNTRDTAISIDAILIQDLGLGMRGFVTNNEAYASQYIDHHIARHPRWGPVVMSRQNLAQNDKHPWIAHACLDGASAFATDAMQLFGPAHRDANDVGETLAANLPDRRLQHEVSCVAIQSKPLVLQPGESAVWRFLALYAPDHVSASTDADLARLEQITWPNRSVGRPAMQQTLRSILQDAPSAETRLLDGAQDDRARFLEESDDGGLLSFFIPDAEHNRHVVLRAKERVVSRRHGSLLRSGSALLPDEATLCATCWMHGVFAAQLTLGNTSFHKLFSVSRDPYNIMRASGLRAMVDAGAGWHLLTVPSAFEMGLSDCRWIYALADRVITVRAVASGDDPAMQWRITIDGPPCRLLIFGHLVLGERELEHAGQVVVDAARHRFTFRPPAQSLWGRHYPAATYHLVTSTPDAIDAMGGDELLYADASPRRGTHAVIRTLATNEFCFAVAGSLKSREEGLRLASEYERPRQDSELLAPATRFWTQVTRGARLGGDGADIAALDASLPWLAHDAMIHLTVPRGLEQYTGAAWGTRDVCQGPVEFFLALEHDGAVKQILKTVFAQQYATRGDWPQWFMLEPYASIQDKHSHGDVIVWPLKALNDYIESTGDTAFLDEIVPWRDDETLKPTAHGDTIAVHVDKLLATIQSRFVPGTHLIRYGEGDWNDSLQPADPTLRDRMASSWTVALLYQQLVRHAAVLRHASREGLRADPGMAAFATTAFTTTAPASKTFGPAALERLADVMRAEFNRYLIRDGAVAGYGIFAPGREMPELLLHPTDVRTGLHYSLLPMTRSIIAGLFTPEQAEQHRHLIRDHLLFPDGARLIDRPVAYHGGPERTFRRAESASFFGREIGLMYVHSHLRYGEAMSVAGDAEALWSALRVVNPITVTDCVANAASRQRNAYFSSSDAAFADRYDASDGWGRVKAGTISVEGGWRIYSSGPGLYVSLLIRHALGMRRVYGRRVKKPLLTDDRRDTVLTWDIGM